MPIFLIIIGLLLIIVNSVALKKENNSFSTSLAKAENDITDVDVKIGKLRKEFAETILDIQVELEEIKKYKKVSDISANGNDFFAKNEGTKYKEIEHKEIIIDDSIHEENVINEPLNKDKTIDNYSNAVKIGEIKKFVQDEYSDDEIAGKLSISKGEVLLIKELYLK